MAEIINKIRELPLSEWIYKVHLDEKELSEFLKLVKPEDYTARAVVLGLCLPCLETEAALREFAFLRGVLPDLLPILKILAPPDIFRQLREWSTNFPENLGIKV